MCLDVSVKGDIKKIAIGNHPVTQPTGTRDSLKCNKCQCVAWLRFHSVLSPPRQPNEVHPIHILLLFGFSFINTPVGWPLVCSQMA